MSAAPAGRVPEVLRQRDFALYFSGQALSFLGDAIVPIALTFAVLEFSDSPTAVGVVLAAQTVPTVLLVLFGGVLSDRLPRRLVMVVSDLVRFGAQGLLAVGLLVGTTSLTYIVTLQLVSGTAAAFFRPASTGLLPEITDPVHLSQGNALLGLAGNAAYTIGPAIAGVLVATVGSGWALLIDSFSFAASAVTLGLITASRIPRRLAKGTSMLADLASGWTEFRSRDWLWVIVAWAGTFHLLVLPAMMVLGPLVAHRSLGGAPAWAVISVSSGIGSVVGGALVLRLRPSRLLFAACLPLALYGLPLLLLAVPAPVALTAAGAFLAGLGLSAFNAYFVTAMQQEVPLDKLSRVSSYDWLGSIALLPLGYALAGPAAALFSTEAVLVTAGLWMVASTGLLLSIRSIRTLRAATAAGEGAPSTAAPITSAANRQGSSSEGDLGGHDATSGDAMARPDDAPEVPPVPPDRPARPQVAGPDPDHGTAVVQR